jgi:TonB family protein
MSHTRIPLSYVKSDDGQRWIGRELGATTVLWAEIVLAHGKNEAKFNVVNARPHKGGGTFKTNLPTLLYKPEELQPVEPYPVLDKIESSKQGEILSKVDKPNIQPSCLYMPNPPPTEEARSRRLSGSILVDAVVLPEGKVKVLRIVRGMPFNLNEQTYKTLETWKCQPVVKNGQAVLTPVQFEVNFRFY